MEISVKSTERERAGMLYGTASFVLWGLLPIYWKLLQAVPSIEVLAHRIFWSFIVMAIVVVVTKGWGEIVSSAGDKRKLLLMFFCGVLISGNWYVYIMAVNTDQVIAASIGYFINPLVVVLLGVIVLKETLNRWQLTAIILAAIGVLIVSLQYGKIPWIALILAGSFALYGLIKKIIQIDPITGLTLETFFVMPVALVYILKLEAGGGGAMGGSPFLISIILIGTGVITSAPLLLYAKGIGNTTFSMIGFLQYIAPSMKLFLGVIVFKEYFSFYHFLSFSFIWAGLAIFTLANLGVLKAPYSVAVGHEEQDEAPRGA